MSHDSTDTITINHVSSDNDPGALYCQYDGQHAPQSCFVELDCERRTLSVAYNPEIGNAIPFTVYHHRVIRWTIPCLTDDAANALLDELADDAAEICDGYECEWDGHNHVGKFTQEADDMIEAVGERCNGPWGESDLVQVWDANDYFGPLGAQETADQYGFTANTDDDDLERIAEKAEEDAVEEGYYVGGTLNHFEWVRDELRSGMVVLEEMPDHLRASHRAAGNWGVYPHNGAERRWVDEDEADDIVEADPDGYARIVED